MYHKGKYEVFNQISVIFWEIEFICFRLKPNNQSWIEFCFCKFFGDNFKILMTRGKFNVRPPNKHANVTIYALISDVSGEIVYVHTKHTLIRVSSVYIVKWWWCCRAPCHAAPFNDAGENGISVSTWPHHTQFTAGSYRVLLVLRIFVQYIGLVSSQCVWTISQWYRRLWI